MGDFLVARLHGVVALEGGRERDEHRVLRIGMDNRRH